MSNRDASDTLTALDEHRLDDTLSAHWAEDVIWSIDPQLLPANCRIRRLVRALRAERWTIEQDPAGCDPSAAGALATQLRFAWQSRHRERRSQSSPAAQLANALRLPMAIARLAAEDAPVDDKRRWQNISNQLQNSLALIGDQERPDIDALSPRAPFTREHYAQALLQALRQRLLVPGPNGEFAWADDYGSEPFALEAARLARPIHVAYLARTRDARELFPSHRARLDYVVESEPDIQAALENKFRRWQYDVSPSDCIDDDDDLARLARGMLRALGTSKDDCANLFSVDTQREAKRDQREQERDARANARRAK